MPTLLLSAASARELLTPPVLLPLPVPYAVRVVNAYLLRGDPLTLVDTGADWQETRLGLDTALAHHGVRVEDLEQILITHQHHDHVGLAHHVKERSGAVVVAHGLLGDFLAGLAWESMEAEDAYQAEVMRIHGVPEPLIEGLYETSMANRAYGGSVEVDRGVREGDTIDAGGLHFRVFERPGHSPSDLIFVEEQGRWVLGGDHLVGTISSNPIVHRPLSGVADPHNRTPALANYLQSLEQTAALDVQVVLPGHGPAVTAHRELIAERAEFHERRKQRIYDVLAAGPHNAHEVALAIWDEVARREPFLTLSEALGHLDLLVGEGRIVATDRSDRTIVYGLPAR